MLLNDTRRAIRDGDPFTGESGVDWDLGFTFDKPAEALAYWQELRAARFAPSRSELSPRGMKRFLANVSITDIAYAKDGSIISTVRVSGTKVAEVHGETTGRDSQTAYPPAVQKRFQAIGMAVIEARRPLRTFAEITTEVGPPLAVEGLWAPLSHENQIVDGLFVVAEYRQLQLL